MQYLRSNYQPAYGLFTQALENTRFAKDRQVSVECWNWLGEVCIAQGRHSDAGRMFRIRARPSRLAWERAWVRARAGRTRWYRLLRGQARKSQGALR